MISSRRQLVLIANPGSDLYGSDRVALETISAFIDRGDRVVVALPVHGPLEQLITERGAEVVIAPTPVIRKSALRPRGMLRLIRDTVASIGPGLRLIRRLRPRLVVVNTITAPLWLPLSRLLRIPVVSHVHEGDASAAALLRTALAAPLLLANRIVVNSQFSLDVLTDAIRPLSRKAQIVYNAVPGPATIKQPRPELSSPVRLLFVGRLSPRKGPDVAIEAVKMLTERGFDVQLDVVGSVFHGYEWFENELRAAASRDDLAGRVVFHGFQSDVWPHLADTDICLVPSTIDEPFGNTAVEAALAARPLIVSRTSGLLEASSGLRSCIRVSPGSAADIADGVGKIIQDWPSFAASAVGDATGAKDRYSVSRYREEIFKITSF